MKASLLVVDDDAVLVDYLVETLNESGFAAEGALSADAALTRVGQRPFDVVVCDVMLSDMRGLDLMRAIHRKRPQQFVVLMSAFANIDLAVESLRAGASDFLKKPFSFESLVQALERVQRDRKLRRPLVKLKSAVVSNGDNGEIVECSPAMQEVLKLARRAAETSSTVLITGESGVGKGAIARYIHDQSARRERPFLQVNCAALPAPLVETELFGARRGAYTDAAEDREGLFQRAHGGSLLLDEIAELPLESQPKLLHAIETGRVRPVGASREVEMNVRIIAATNSPPEKALRERRLRPDIYYRLNVIRIDVPPLRTRPEDIEALVDSFMVKASSKLDRPVLAISDEAMRWLRAQSWPGNVRELSNVLERAVAMAEHDTIVLADVAWQPPNGHDLNFLDQAVLERIPLERVEQTYIRKVVESVRGNVLKAARILGIDRRTVYRKLERVDPTER